MKKFCGTVLAAAIVIALPACRNDAPAGTETTSTGEGAAMAPTDPATTADATSTAADADTATTSTDATGTGATAGGTTADAQGDMGGGIQDGTQPDATPAGTAGMPAGTGERGALGVLNAINDHEIAAGRQALDKKVKGKVADYARMMIDEHGKNREQTLALKPDADSADAQAQKRKGEAELRELGGKQGQEYERAYVQAMISGHTEALSALDQKLLPAVTSDPAKAHLKRTREHVAHHLELAKALQANANADSGKTDGGSN